MTIDYDGIRSAYEYEVNGGLHRLLSSLVEAMKDGEVTAQSLVYVWAICEVCDGHGGHSRRFGAFTSDEFAEWDEDSRDSYLSGDYDCSCERCGSTGKVKVLDVERLTEDAQAWLEENERAIYENAEASYYERRAGC